MQWLISICLCTYSLQTCLPSIYIQCKHHWSNTLSFLVVLHHHPHFNTLNFQWQFFCWTCIMFCSSPLYSFIYSQKKTPESVTFLPNPSPSHPANSIIHVRSLISTIPNQQPGLIISSSITGLLQQRAFLPLCPFSHYNTFQSQIIQQKLQVTSNLTAG